MGLRWENMASKTGIDGKLSQEDQMDLPGTDAGGAVLRAARLAKGLEIADIANELRIPKLYLAALESETYDELPGATYGHGYIKSYCKMLGIDATPHLDKYKMMVARNQSQPSYHFPDEVLEPRMSGAMSAMLVVLVLFAGYLGWQVLDAYQLNPLTLPTLTHEVAEQDAPAVEAPAIPVAPTLTNQEVIAANDSDKPSETSDVVEEATPSEDETPAPAVAEVEETVIAQTPAAEEEVAPASEAPAVADEEEVVVAEVAEVADEAPATATSVSALATAREPEDEVILSVIAPSWVEVVRENGDVLLSKLFKPGDQYIAPANEKLYLSTGNAGGLVLTLPGLNEFTMGEVGEIIRDVPLSRDSLRARRAASLNQ